MKLTLAKPNRAFTRTQWLVIICLAVVAFEFGARFAEKQKDPPPAPVVKATNIVVTNFWVMADEEEPIPVELETNAPADADTNMAPIRLRYKQADGYVRPAEAPRTPPGQPEILRGDGDAVLRRLPRRTNALPVAVGNPSYGVRIAVP